MLVLISYDVNTTDGAGRARLRRIAKECVNYGQRVQSSVFECLLDNAEYQKVKQKLLSLMDPARDSLRFYNLGRNYQSRIEEYGARETYDPEGFLEI